MYAGKLVRSTLVIKKQITLGVRMLIVNRALYVKECACPESKNIFLSTTVTCKSAKAINECLAKVYVCKQKQHKSVFLS